MALNSVKFRIEGDGTSALRALNDVKRGMVDVKDVMSKEISTKIKQAFSVGAIEEMTRRTAEWATQLTNTAKHLQVTTQELQGFQIAGSRIGLDTGKIEGFFNTMEDSAREALKGNTDLLKSFGQLGIKMDDLRNKSPAKLFESVLGGLKQPFGVQGAQDIFGRADTVDLQRISNVMGGATGEQYADKSGLAVKDNDLQEITVAWRSVTEGFKQLAVELTPFIKVILAIVTAIMKIVKGVLGTFTGIIGDIGTMLGQISVGDFKGAAKTFGKMSISRLTNVGAGVAKAATFGFGDKAIDEWMAPGNKMLKDWGMGLDEREKQNAEGVGEGIGVVLTGKAVGNVVGAGERGLRGMAANRAGRAADEFAQMFGYEDELAMRGAAQAGKQIVTGKPDFRIPKAREMFDLNRIANEAQGSRLGRFGAGEFGLTGATKFSAQVAQGTQLSQLGGLGNAEIQKRLREVGDLPFNGRNPLMNLGAFGGGGGGGGANLRIGGVFGTDVSFKIVQLNQEMVSILSRMLGIMESSNNPASYTTVNLH